MFSITDSLSFLVSVRATLCDCTQVSEGIHDSEKELLINFFINEGTDYEIMHFFIRGEFPEERYNRLEEKKIFEELKTNLRKDFSLLKKYIDEDTLRSVFLEVGPISQLGLSSSADALESMASGNVILSEDSKVPSFKKLLGFDTAKTKKMRRTASGKWREVRKIPPHIWNILKKSAKRGKIHDITAFYANHRKSIKLIAAGIAISLIAIASYRIYKYHISQAGRNCLNFTGPERNNCIRKYRLEGSKKQLDALRAGLSSCDNTSKPEKCKIVISEKIRKVEERISRLSKEV